MTITVGNGYTFRGADFGTREEFIYIIDNVTPTGSVDIQVCKIKPDSDWETQGESPIRWVCVNIETMYRMIDQGFYVLIRGKSYMKEVERFRP
jgi:hypothetical protein